MNKLVSFKYYGDNKNFAIDAKQLSIALDGVNALVMDILIDIKSKSSQELKKSTRNLLI